MNLNKTTHIYIPIITIIYLIVNTYLLLTNSYCNTSGCGATKSIINIEQKYLYFLAIFSFIILIILGFLINKKNTNKINNISLKLFNVIILSLLIIETIFITYLYFYTKEFCIICLGFYILLLINNLFVFKLYNQFQNLIIIVMIIIGMSILKIENKKVKINNTILLYDNKENKDYLYLKGKFDFYNMKYDEDKYTNYLDILDSFNIQTLPILIVKEDDKIVILESKEKINKYIK